MATGEIMVAREGTCSDEDKDKDGAIVPWDEILATVNPSSGFVSKYQK